jgi:hypothetical protein
LTELALDGALRLGERYISARHRDEASQYFQRAASRD